MTFYNNAVVTLAMWRLAPGWSVSARFMRATVKAVIVMAESRLGRDLTGEEACRLLKRFADWMTPSTFVDEPVRQIHLFLTLEPWRAE